MRWQFNLLLIVFFFSSPIFAQSETAEGHMRQAKAFCDLRRYNEAEKEYLDAMREAERLGPRNPTLISTLDEMAGFYVMEGKPEKAEQIYRRELDLRISLTSRQSPEVAQNQRRLAQMYMATGNYSEAEPLLRDAVDSLEKIVERNSSRPQSNYAQDRLALADSLDDLAKVLRQMGRGSEASQVENRSIEIRSNPSAN